MAQKPSDERTLALISIGSNLGDRLEQIKSANSLIENIPDSRVELVSSVYKTAPWGVTDQPDFYNLVLGLNTSLSAEKLLDALQQIESELGRERLDRWGPRTMDLDIIDFGGIQRQDERLQLPHPYFAKRDFVLVPLAEIYPNHTINQQSVSTWLKQFLQKNPDAKLPEKI